MTIPTERLPSYICDQPVKLRNLGATWPEGEVSPTEALELIRLGCVDGIGSRSKLRYLRMVITDTEAHGRIAARAKGLSRERSRTPTETLLKMISSRKFTFREHLTERCSITDAEEKTGRWVYQHKAVA